MVCRTVVSISVALGLVLGTSLFAQERVNVRNFPQAETETYFKAIVAQGALGEMTHERELTPIDAQTVVQMNRDTLYSSAVFDLSEPVTITAENDDGRFQSFLIINQKNFVKGVEHAPTSFELTQERMGSRYATVLVRTLVDINNDADIKLAHAAQDSISVSQSDPGSLELTDWDKTTLDDLRAKLKPLAEYEPDTFGRFADENEIDPVNFLIGTAIGWGGNPREAAVYFPSVPDQNNGKQAFTMTMKDVPVDGFWSLSVYNKDGFFVENEHDAYTVNNLTAQTEEDGSVIIHFGGDPDQPNYLYLPENWKYLMRLYRPEQEIIDGSWEMPQLVAVNP
ncbi:MAG: DUF1214 domain-containing protein [Paracoccaceae bacterium]|nr:DUF1214 domain-containing protein [Paracoccaceae bacterium]